MIQRPLYLDQLRAFKDKDIIKVVTGIRRSGKSSLLESFADILLQEGVKKSHIIKINLEDLKYDGMDYQTLNKIITDQLKATKAGKMYVFLDEIQRVEQWEKVANSLMLEARIDLYLTGSNAYMLSSELSTYLSGRYVEIKMLPLSFKEFLSFYKFPADMNKNDKFELYVKFGGMPSLAIYNFEENQTKKALDGIYNTVLIKDVLARDSVKDQSILQKLIKFMADNIGNITSTNSITNVLVAEKTLSSQNNKLIENYITLLENAFFFYKVGRYDIRGKEHLRSLEKYYIVDTGLRDYLLGRVKDTGRILENIVYFELLRRDYNVSIGKIGEQEIDFIATKGADTKYIQVSQSILDENTKQREIAPLEAVKDSFEKIVLTTDVLFTGVSETGIKIINLIDWLME